MPVKPPVLGDVLRQRDVLLLAMLLLLKERQSHGYELHSRLREFSVNMSQLASGGIYRLLRQMEEENLVSSVWEGGHGPARRTYSITQFGVDFLHDSMPWVVCQRNVLGEIATRYRSAPRPAQSGTSCAPAALVVASDNQRDLLRTLLATWGWIVSEAATGARALDDVLNESTDAVVIDECLVDTTAVLLAGALRDRGFRSSIVVCLTQPEPDVGSLATAVGFDVVDNGDLARLGVVLAEGLAAKRERRPRSRPARLGAGRAAGR